MAAAAVWLRSALRAVGVAVAWRCSVVPVAAVAWPRSGPRAVVVAVAAWPRSGSVAVAVVAVVAVVAAVRVWCVGLWVVVAGQGWLRWAWVSAEREGVGVRRLPGAAEREAGAALRRPVGTRRAGPAAPSGGLVRLRGLRPRPGDEGVRALDDALQQAGPRLGSRLLLP
ncbi:hypothetical protein GXW83_22260 [Streptacidiphilus sp. PB12-B1b]|uniref:hypothetical protein n=1 Tax=Streptacidiphilus sp. PB12-B1b TaxID=2705012 RepID=UPI0015FBBA8E|nr:hypothetical protein [Streptacidiphilus sp. PB12-B1b]QMU78013.1 hypothetical protein GXW83_22260 [Streptacidiphilus sp. PB12-B1b]